MKRASVAAGSVAHCQGEDYHGPTKPAGDHFGWPGFVPVAVHSMHSDNLENGHGYGKEPDGKRRMVPSLSAKAYPNMLG